MSIAELPPSGPERTVEIYTGDPHALSTFRLSGDAQHVDGAVHALLQSPVTAGGYVIEETANGCSVVAPQAELGAEGQMRLRSLPSEWVPLNEEVLGRVRPPLRDYEVQRIAEALAAVGIHNCGDVIEGGLLGLSRAGLFTGELEIVTGLVKALTGRDRLPIGNEG